MPQTGGARPEVPSEDSGAPPLLANSRRRRAKALLHSCTWQPGSARLDGFPSMEIAMCTPPPHSFSFPFQQIACHLLLFALTRHCFRGPFAIFACCILGFLERNSIPPAGEPHLSISQRLRVSMVKTMIRCPGLFCQRANSIGRSNQV